MANISRRGFLGRLAAGIAASSALTLIDPEKILWVPGAKTIFLPAGDIAIKNIRLATDGEAAQLGHVMLRVKWNSLEAHHERGIHNPVVRVEQIQLFPEANFKLLTAESRAVRQAQGFMKVATAGDPFELMTRGSMEVHFPDGSVAHGVDPRTMSYAQIKTLALDNQREQQQRAAERDKFKRRFSINANSEGVEDKTGYLRRLVEDARTQGINIHTIKEG